MANLTFKEKLTGKFIYFYALAVLLLWIKTYITQLTQFDLGVEGTLQEFLLLLNPLGTAMLFLGLAFFFKGRRKYIALLVIYSVMSIFCMPMYVFTGVRTYHFADDFAGTQNIG